MPITLSQALHPFIGARLNAAPRTHAVDIHEARIAHVDADVRAVTADGIRVFFDSESRVIPWSDILEVQIVRKGEGRAIERSFRVGAELARAA